MTRVKIGKTSKSHTPDIQIISRVATQGLCTGCGVCAAICLPGALSMHLNKDGEYIPVLGDGCTECNLCCSVCPQLVKDEADASGQNLLSIAPEALLGGHEELSTWAGYALDARRRLRSASGGLLTLVLKYLFDTHQIDSAIVVGPANLDVGVLFEARLVRTAEELDACAGSKYYPVELSKVLRELKSTKKKAAVVGLPCHSTGVRAMSRVFKPLREQIQYMFGFVCGHGVSTIFTDLLCAAAGVSLTTVDQVVYRAKEGSTEASNFVFSAFRCGKKIGKSLSFKNSLYRAAWVRRLFVPRACDFCTDCFAENADATFMDAWLPEYVKDPRGTSFIISRTPQVTEILRGLSNTGLANLWKVTSDDIVRAQAGVIRFKRELLPSRVYSAVSRGKPVPERLRGFDEKGTRAQRRENIRYERHGRIARWLWRLKLPACIRLRIIIFITSPGFIYMTKSLLKRISGQKGTLILKKMLVLFRHGKRSTYL